MDWNEFKSKLQKANLNIELFAQMMGKSKSSIYSWSSRGIPDWVESWLDNYIKAKNCEYSLNELSKEYDLWYKSAMRTFLQLEKKGLLNKVVKHPDDILFITNQIKAYKEAYGGLLDNNPFDDTPLETEAETKAKEVVAKAPNLDEDVKQEIIAAFKEEILKELRKAKEEERIAKKLQEIEQKMQEIQKKLDEQEKKED